MNNLGDIPVGSNSDKAPWNKTDNYTVVPVTMSMTMSTSVDLRVKKDYNNNDLKEAAMTQLDLPSSGCNWDVDEFEIIED